MKANLCGGEKQIHTSLVAIVSKFDVKFEIKNFRRLNSDFGRFFKNIKLLTDSNVISRKLEINFT